MHIDPIVTGGEQQFRHQNAIGPELHLRVSLQRATGELAIADLEREVGDQVRLARAAQRKIAIQVKCGKLRESAKVLQPEPVYPAFRMEGLRSRKIDVAGSMDMAAAHSEISLLDGQSCIGQCRSGSECGVLFADRLMQVDRQLLFACRVPHAGIARQLGCLQALVDAMQIECIDQQREV